MKIAIIGGGAAGFFAALACAAQNPEHQVFILEKTTKLLSKVKVSGGGRCNVTNSCHEISTLSKQYPRGEKVMKKLLRHFSTPDTVQWFEQRGVSLHAETDGRMFPTTNNSQTIIDCFLEQAALLNVKIYTSFDVLTIKVLENQGFELTIKNNPIFFADRLIVASGGSPKIEGLDWLKNLGHTIENPVPSLFTFNLPKNPIVALQGVSTQAKARLQGTKLATEGALLVTHWGLSGPAILRLSAWGARMLATMHYDFTVQIVWLPQTSENDLRQQLNTFKQEIGARQVGNRNYFQLPARLWEFLLHKIELPLDKKWNELSNTHLNRLTNVLLNDCYKVEGKTTFKEEFVTCGGVSLDDINVDTMESKHCKNLFFAGEVLDIDGITGGFNFQAAWTTGYIAGFGAAGFGAAK